MLNDFAQTFLHWRVAPLIHHDCYQGASPASVEASESPSTIHQLAISVPFPKSFWCKANAFKSCKVSCHTRASFKSTKHWPHPKAVIPPPPITVKSRPWYSNLFLDLERNMLKEESMSRLESVGKHENGKYA